jgi:Multiubiquitin
MHAVRILVNNEELQSHTPTTGRALYELAELGEDRELFHETNDPKDALVRRDATEIHLKEDEHFYSEKIVTIIVEGKPHRWPEDQLISFDQVVKLEIPKYPNGIIYAVKYSDGPPRNPEGPLLPGEKVKVKEGMIFNVSETGQS